MDTVARNLERYPLLVLDGAFGTELARRGFDTNDELWSAKALFEKPELVEAVHRDYYEAGADVSTSASYQATVEGFEKKGYGHSGSDQILRKITDERRRHSVNAVPPVHSVCQSVSLGTG